MSTKDSFETVILALSWILPISFYISLRYSYPWYLFFSFGVLGYLITNKLMK